MGDDAEVLRQITRGDLNKGLRGVPVGTCRTSRVDPEHGVSYVGYDIAELASLDPEAVVHLLLHRRLPTDAELDSFRASLRAVPPLDPQVLGLLAALPRQGHPMEWLSVGLVSIGMTSKSGDYEVDALNVIAWAPELVAAIYRIRSGWGEPIPRDPSLGLIENFVHMLGVPGGDHAKLSQLLRTFYVLHLDHGGGNLSTFVGKAIASAHTDLFSSLAGAMAGLYGPLHGRANQDCLDFVRRIGTSDPAEVERFVRQELAQGGKIFGFGHAVLRNEDPRATIEYALGERICPDDPLFATARTLREVAVRVLSEHPKISNPYPNVDAVSGSLLNATGLTDANYYTLLFGLARITGIAAQIVDERVRFRGGRGVPIYRPKYVAEDQPAQRIGSTFRS
ncbi:MAG: citrate (Si)-synthase [Myxococcales bacterium]|nr:citrate (Si)-synthase [Myxococcales bacterium]